MIHFLLGHTVCALIIFARIYNRVDTSNHRADAVWADIVGINRWADAVRPYGSRFNSAFSQLGSPFQ
jgi:hypothetical protein